MNSDLPCSGAVALRNASFGEGTGRIWLNNLQCVGSELFLTNCFVNASEINTCTHSQDAGVRCPQGMELDIKLHNICYATK